MNKKKLLAERILLANDKPFYPTKHSVTRWFNILNDVLFDNKLIPFYNIEIRRRHSCVAEIEIIEDWDGYRYSNLSIHNKFSNIQSFINTLGHEMVHHYEFINSYKENHNPVHNKNFFSWKPKFEELNLQLAYAYDI